VFWNMALRHFGKVCSTTTLGFSLKAAPMYFGNSLLESK
jgi:hypothetical protein